MLDLNYVLMLSNRDTDIREHLLLLYSLPIIIDAKTIVEIGAGQSTFALMAAANKLADKGLGTEFYSIDLTREARFRGFPEGKDLDGEPRFHFISGNSLEIQWKIPIDFLFIDSGHTYQLTIDELTKWNKFVRKNGLIALHDTGINNTELAECRKAVDDFLVGKNFTRVQYDNQNGFTILKKL